MPQILATANARRAVALVAAILIAVALVVVVILVFGANPIATLGALVRGVVGSPYTIGQTITIAGVLCLTGMAALVPFSAQLWNVGGEGQLLMGAVGSVTVALLMPDVPVLSAVLPVLGGMTAGAIWAFVPGALKAWFGASEMIVSLLLNFLALEVVDYWTTTLFPDASGHSTRSVSDAATLPTIWTAGTVGIGVVLALIVVLVMDVVMQRTRFGFAVRAAGLNPRAARLAGFSARGTTISGFLVAGAAAGLAGAVLVQGVSGQVTSGLSANYGYIGVAVALVAALRPVLLIPSAVLFAALSVGSNGLQVAVGLPKDVGSVIVAVLVVALLATSAIRIRQQGARA